MFVFLGWDRRSGRNIGSKKIKVCNFNKFPPFNEGGFWHEPCSWILRQLKFWSWDQKSREIKSLARPKISRILYLVFDSIFWFLGEKNCHNIFVFWFLFSHNNNILIEEFLCIVFFFSLATSWIEYLIVIVYDRNWVSVSGWNRKPRLLSFGFGITYRLVLFSAGQGWTSCFDFCLYIKELVMRASSIVIVAAWNVEVKLVASKDF